MLLGRYVELDSDTSLDPLNCRNPRAIPATPDRPQPSWAWVDKSSGLSSFNLSVEPGIETRSVSEGEAAIVNIRPTRQKQFVLTAFMRSFVGFRCTASMDRGNTNGLGECLPAIGCISCLQFGSLIHTLVSMHFGELVASPMAG